MKVSSTLPNFFPRVCVFFTLSRPCLGIFRLLSSLPTPPMPSLLPTSHRLWVIGWMECPITHTRANTQSEWFRDALLDLPPTSTSITLTATPAKTERAAYVAQATGSSNMRRSHRADVGNFGIKAIGTFGQTQVSVGGSGLERG